MYTKFIRNFNSFFGKKGNYIFSTILIIFSILLFFCSVYAFNNTRIRNKKYDLKYVLFQDDKGYFIGNNGLEEVTFLSYNDGNSLNPKDYNNKVLKMFCLKSSQKNCFYGEKIYSYNYAFGGFLISFILFSLGLICKKLYKIRNINYGSIKIFRPFMITLFIFGVYLFTLQIYNLVSYMRFENNKDNVVGNVIGVYDNKYLVEYIVNEKHYSTLVSKPNDKEKHEVMNVKYDVNDPSISYDKSNFNIFLLMLGIIISYSSMMFMISEVDIDKKIKIMEKRNKKESYRRKK